MQWAHAQSLCDWAGRLPNTALAVAGAAVLFELLRRVGGTRAACVALWVQLTSPSIGFSRLTEGEPSGGSAVALAVAGFTVAAFGRNSPAVVALSWAGGCAGLVLGARARGPLIGVALPAATIALGWAALGFPRRSRFAGLLTATAAALGSAAFLLREPEAATRPLPTFDAVLAELAHVFFPWSALLPCALAVLAAGSDDDDGEERALGVLLFGGLVLSVAFESWAARAGEATPFSGGAFIAACIGLGLAGRRSNGAHRVTPATLMSAAIFGALLTLDFVRFPEKRTLALTLARTAFDSEASVAPGGTVLFAIAGATAVAGALASALAIGSMRLRGRLPKLCSALAHAAWFGAGLGALPITTKRFDPEGMARKPLEELLLQSWPSEMSEVSADFSGRVALRGFELLDDRGIRPGAVRVSAAFRVRIYFEVMRANLAGHCTFLHIDHRPSRFAAEHRSWSRYPMSRWAAGDRIADEYTVELPLHFRPGKYPLYFGFGVLPCHDERRLLVSSGAHDQNRVRLGTLEVQR